MDGQTPADPFLYMEDTYDSIAINEDFLGFDFAQSFHPQQHLQPSFIGHEGRLSPPSQGPYNTPYYPRNMSHLPTNILDHAKSEADDSSGRGFEENNITPAQFKRKAQNRAAQQAFRKRKEKHVKDLEAKIAKLEAAQQAALLENKHLKRDLQKIRTENEILKATFDRNALNSHGSSYLGSYSHFPEPITTTISPMRYNPKGFASSIFASHNKSFFYWVAYTKNDQRLLTLGASWDIITNHKLFKRGLVDIGSLSKHLRTRTVYDGYSPVFSQNDVLEAIEMSVASGSDDLLQ